MRPTLFADQLEGGRWPESYYLNGFKLILPRLCRDCKISIVDDGGTETGSTWRTDCRNCEGRGWNYPPMPEDWRLGTPEVKITRRAKWEMHCWDSWLAMRIFDE